MRPTVVQFLPSIDEKCPRLPELHILGIGIMSYKTLLSKPRLDHILSFSAALLLLLYFKGYWHVLLQNFSENVWS